MSFAPKKESWDAAHASRDGDVVDRISGSGRPHGGSKGMMTTRIAPPLRVEPSFADDDSSEWLSEWGEAPRGAHESDRPGWRGGGRAPDRVQSKKPARASRPLPVAVVAPGSSPSVGVAAVEAALRGWLTRNRALHEPKRITLIRMLGTGLRDEAPSSGTDENAEFPTLVADETARFARLRTSGASETKYVNGIPLDRNGRPVGVSANYPDPRYAAVDGHGKPLPLESRIDFIPKPMPPSKRSYHPQASSFFGAQRRDGTWDSAEENPRDTDPRNPDDVAREKSIRKAPAVRLTRDQFQRACLANGVGAFTDRDVLELFARRSTRVGGEVLEIEAFADALLASPQRELGDGDGGIVAVKVLEARRRKGEGLGAPRDFEGKISYRPCRVGVFAPSDWDRDCERRSEKPPNVFLNLEWAHGVSVAGVGHLLRCCDTADDASAASAATRSTRKGRADADAAADGDRSDDETGTIATGTDDETGTTATGTSDASRWAYAVGALGVVYDSRKRSQMFFRGHDDEVVSLAVHPSGKWAATGQAGRAPCACVWDTRTGLEVARLRHAPGDRAVAAIAFGPGEGDADGEDGQEASPARIVTVASDATHCVRVWDWGGGHRARRGRAYEVFRAPGRGGGISSLATPRIRGAAFAPDADVFATFGEGHVKVWSPRCSGGASDVTATGFRPQGAAAAAAAAAARFRAFSLVAALPGGAGSSCFGYAAQTCVDPSSRGLKSTSRGSLPAATCGAFAPGPGNGHPGVLVTGHVDGRVRVWHAAALVCVGLCGEAIRALDVTPSAFAGRTEIVTGGGDGYARRWGLFRDRKDAGVSEGTEGKAFGVAGGGLELRALGVVEIPREAPEGSSGRIATVRAVAANARGGIAAVTSVGDLWISKTVSPAKGTEGRLPSSLHQTEARHLSFACATRGQPSAARDVAWHPSRGLFAVAGGGSRVAVYDASAKMCVALLWAADPVPGRITACAFSPEPAPETFPEEEDTEEGGGALLALGTADGFVRLVRLRRTGPGPRFSYRAREVARSVSNRAGAPITSVSFSPDGSRFVAASESVLAVHRVVGAPRASEPAKGVASPTWLPSKRMCKGHAGAVASADWSADGSTVRATSRCGEILHFDAESGRQAVGDFRDAEWHTWTAPFGFQVMGVFQNAGVGGDAINSVSRLEGVRGEDAVVAVGDDFGRVRVLRYPCVAREAPAVEEIEAHASHVACVRFAPERVGRASSADDDDDDAADDDDDDARGGSKRGWKGSAGSLSGRRLVSAGGADRAALQWFLRPVDRNDDALLPGSDDCSPLVERFAEESSAPSASADPAIPFDEFEFGDSRETERFGANARFRRTQREALETRVSRLLSTARAKPPARIVKPWLKKPSIDVRARDAGRIVRGPRRPDTPPEETGEALEYVDGEYVWADPKRRTEASS